VLKLEKIPKNIKKFVKGKMFQEEYGVSFLLKEKSVKDLKNVLQKLL
jgi:hypothetical protein